VVHDLWEYDYFLSAMVKLSIFVVFAFELYLHQCFSNFVLSAIVPSDYWAVGVPEKGIEEIFAIVD
jgi:hypothetical protein